MKLWLAGALSLQVSLTLAADLPPPADHDDFPVPGATSILLGRQLFFDPVLSGNQNISCATCHHPALGSGDPVSLGEDSLGIRRKVGPANLSVARRPRNAPALYNLGAREFTTLFHDGRVQVDDSARFNLAMPPGRALERHLPSPLAAQTLLPITSYDKMSGQPGENQIADAVAAGHIRGQDGAWQMLAARVEAIPEYRKGFDLIIGKDEPIHITDIARAIADYITFDFRTTDSRFDAFLRGDDAALTNAEVRGMSLFYGKGGCADCHNGTFQTDHGFHAIGIPQLSPDKGHEPDHADHGRAAVTGDPADAYKFRTPSLRNVTLTAPYGHNGAYDRLEDMVRHHLDPLTMLAEYTHPSVPDSEVPLFLQDDEVDAILEFLGALEDPIARTGRLGVPDAVPSGLPLDPQNLTDLPPS